MPRSSKPRLSFYPTGESTGSGITIEQISGMPTGLSGYPPPADLERLRFKNFQPPRSLLSEPVTTDYLRPYKANITLRWYQIKAIDESPPHFRLRVVADLRTFCRVFHSSGSSSG